MKQVFRFSNQEVADALAEYATRRGQTVLEGRRWFEIESKGRVIGFTELLVDPTEPLLPYEEPTCEEENS